MLPSLKMMQDYAKAKAGKLTGDALSRFNARVAAAGFAIRDGSAAECLADFEIVDADPVAWPGGKRVVRGWRAE